MSSEPMQRQQWYVRKGGRTQGPLAVGSIAHEILLGRMRATDELSTDREHWQPLSSMPQLMPALMRHADTEQGRQQLLLARLREDERQHERRHATYAPVDSNRRHGDQRTVESFDLVAPPELTTRPAGDGEKEEINMLLPAAVVLMALFILAMYFLW